MLVNVINSGYLKQTMFAGSHSTAYACLQSSPFLEARPRAPGAIRREARLTNFDWGDFRLQSGETLAWSIKTDRQIDFFVAFLHFFPIPYPLTTLPLKYL